MAPVRGIESVPAGIQVHTAGEDKTEGARRIVIAEPEVTIADIGLRCAVRVTLEPGVERGGNRKRVLIETVIGLHD